MTELSRERVESALQRWTDPYLGRDLLSARAVRDIRTEGGSVACGQH